MSEEEIIKNNELIAKFMGGRYETNLPFAYTKSGWTGTPANSIDQIVQSHTFRYNSSWNWIMPVIEKIEENYYTEIIGTNTKNDNSYVMNIFDYNGKFILDPHSHSSKLELIFITVVDFIKWYNQNKLNETN